MIKENTKKIKVGCKDCQLSRIQVEEIKSLLIHTGSTINFENIYFKTKKKCYQSNGNSDYEFISDVLTNALINRKIDLAIIRAKELPDILGEGLSLYCLTASPDDSDSFIGKSSFYELPKGARVGVKGNLRIKAIKRLNPDLDVINMKGSIEQQVRLVEEGWCDGIITETVLLKRLGLVHYIQNIMPWETTPFNGQLAVIGRSDDNDLRKIFSVIDTRNKKESILYTGTNPQKYKELGRIIHFPMIKISEVRLNPKDKKALFDKIYRCHVVLFTSLYSVHYFFQILKRNKFPLSDLNVKDFIVMGNDTAKVLSEYNFAPALLAGREINVGLFEEITKKYDLKGKRILFPRSSLVNPYIKEELSKLGSIVEEFTVYKNIKPEKRMLPKELINKVLFTSPSTVRNFLEDYESIPDKWDIISKGHITSKILKDAGYDSDVLIST